MSEVAVARHGKAVSDGADRPHLGPLGTCSGQESNMLNSLKQNILFLIFVVLSCNIFLLSYTNVSSFMSKNKSEANYDIIDCGDSSGKTHKCIRVDSKAGEINDPAKDASYRVIYGH
ncbi:hypothetical protein [Methylobacterium sp. J-076]|uniref:hypothetical protein n=1 Tax=Methylobacterium sp. J-076 TaxID=2836655 RepID=UPI001FBB3F7D|nr:hypothetical protein [Methylobacterium sp. J-076]MCJ2013053.1 hypothetical protein [Methylobacterium sp. J-076]